MSQKPYTIHDLLPAQQEAFKRMCLLFACIDILDVAIDGAKGTVFYRQKLKNLLNQLQAEQEAMQKTFSQLMPDVAYTSDWLSLKPIAEAYLNAIYKTNIGKLDVLVSLLNAYNTDQIIIEETEEG